MQYEAMQRILHPMHVACIANVASGRASTQRTSAKFARRTLRLRSSRIDAVVTGCNKIESITILLADPNELYKLAIGSSNGIKSSTINSAKKLKR